MNEFKEEFSQLLQRYASKETTDKNRTPEMPTPLTNQQILDAIQETLLVTLNINLQNIEAAALKTPANEIIITTPDAPDVLRVDYNQNNTLQTRYNSLKSVNVEDDFLKVSNSCLLSRFSEKDANLSSLDTSTVKTTSLTSSINKETESGTPLTDTFLLEEKDVFNTKLENFEQKIKKEIPKIDASKNMTMYNMIEDARKHVMKVTHQLEDLKELLMPETRPIRRLSAIMSLPMLKQQQQHQQQNQSAAWSSSSSNSSSLRTTQRAKALRRSMHQLNENVSVTPTSSRLSLVPPPPPPPSSSSLAKKAPRPASKLALGQRNHSVSTSAPTESNKSAGGAAAATSKSPSKTSQPAKSSKYAHVQSTIPKPTSSAVKRKVL